jgi:hypothetical protein
MWGGRAAQVEQDVRVAEIEVGERLRELGEGAVADLMVSIQETGLIQPIVLRPLEREDGEIGLQLVAGAHRLEAHRRLGRETIRARVIDLSDLDAQQAEIDENLVRQEVVGWPRCRFVAARAGIYAERHPEAVRNIGDEGPRGRGRPRKDQFPLRGGKYIPSLMGFVAEVADQTGLDRSTIERDAQIWAALHPFDAQIRALPLAHDTRALKRLAAAPPELRAPAIELLASGKTGDVSDALVVADGGKPASKPAQTPVDQAVKAFRKLWGDASPSARAAILNDLAGRSLPKGWIVREDR